VAQLPDLVDEAARIVGFTGAVVSTESGIPDFRSPGGVWIRYGPATLVFARSVSVPDARARSWHMRRQCVAAGARPTPAPGQLHHRPGTARHSPGRHVYRDPTGARYTGRVRVAGRPRLGDGAVGGRHTGSPLPAVRWLGEISHHLFRPGPRARRDRCGDRVGP